MMEERAQEIVDRCRDQLGADLRAVYTYDAADHAIVYTRDDIDYGYTEDRLGTLLDSLREVHQNLRGMGTDKEPLGAPETSVLRFEYALVVQFIEGEQGIAVAVDRDADGEIHDFIRACRDVL